MSEGSENDKREQSEALEKKLANATAQLDRGEGISIEDIREELRKKEKAAIGLLRFYSTRQ